MDVTKDVLFVGYGTTTVMWYRIALPAMSLGCDYVGLWGEPPDATYATGLVGKESRLPNFTDYKVIVIQQPHGHDWLKFIRELQSRGIVVIYEVDDWLHAIQHQKDHDWHRDFDRFRMSDYEMCMRAADAMIVSTDFLARTYKAFNRKIFVCENGVDLGRYDYALPGRRTVNIGWAGGTGHRDAVIPWLQVVAKIMRKRSDVCFVSIGENFAGGFRGQFGPERCLSVPFTAIEQYPAAMTHMDIVIAPAAHTGFYRGKSDLRWVEAGALGIPTVAHPLVYPKIESGWTGILAESPTEIEEGLEYLITSRDVRLVIGENARRYVRQHRSAQVTSQRWADVIRELLDSSAR